MLVPCPCPTWLVTKLLSSTHRRLGKIITDHNTWKSSLSILKLSRCNVKKCDRRGWEAWPPWPCFLCWPTYLVWAWWPRLKAQGLFSPVIWFRPVDLTKICTGFNLRAGVSSQITETCNFHLPLQHLTHRLVWFYITWLRKNWISHLVKGDCIACCFLSCSLSFAHGQPFIPMLSHTLGYPQWRDRQETSSYKKESQSLSQLFYQKQIFPSGVTSASAHL